jgi:hypothetical protein
MGIDQHWRITMIYSVLVEITYLGGRESLADDARRALRSAILADLCSPQNIDVTVSALSVSARSDLTIEVRAVLRGISPASLTSPLEAISRLDTSLNRSLMRTGMFEEFDMARRSLHVAVPEQDVNTTSSEVWAPTE